MKYKFGVVKRITLLLMTMALAVAMVACQAATPKPAEQGEQGEQGEAGPVGPPGTTDNDPPMATMDLPMVYLALTGSGKVPDKKGINLDEHFSDAEKAALTYEAEFDPPDKSVVDVKVADGKLDVLGKGAGMATVTVKAYDGVNLEPAMSSFEVMVVASNIAPSVTVVNSGEPGRTGENIDSYSDLSEILYAERKVTVQMTVDPGVAGTTADTVTFEAIMGKKGADDDVVTVKVDPKMGAPGSWDITLTPKNAGRQTVYLLMKDKFGKEVWDADLKFVAMTNTMPMRDDTLPEAKLLMTGAADRNSKTYPLLDYFVLSEKAETGLILRNADDSAYLDAGDQYPDDAASVADGMTASEKYLTRRDTERPTALVTAINDVTCTASTNDTAIAIVAVATDADPLVSTITGAFTATSSFTVTGVKAGTAELTITCRDVQGGDVGTATIKVRA